MPCLLMCNKRRTARSRLLYLSTPRENLSLKPCYVRAHITDTAPMPKAPMCVSGEICMPAPVLADDAVLVGDAVLALEASLLPEIGLCVVVGVTCPGVVETDALATAVIVTGKKVISVASRACVSMPVVWAALPPKLSVQSADVVPYSLQSMLAVLCTFLFSTRYRHQGRNWGSLHSWLRECVVQRRRSLYHRNWFWIAAVFGVLWAVNDIGRCGRIRACNRSDQFLWIGVWQEQRNSLHC